MRDPRAVSRGNRNAVVAAVREQVGRDPDGEGASGGTHSPGRTVVVHNHPSGLLEPSEADLAVAARLFGEGVGSAITDNEASRLYVVVEPPEPRVVEPLEVEEVDRLLAPGGALSGVHRGYEDRAGQRAMARLVTERYNEGGVALVEAGTGTGKSLAYLAPAALWALENGERTVVSTNTINLQEQVVGKDLPLLERVLGRELRWSLVKGRGNYVSIRRLRLAAATAGSLFDEDRSEELDGLLRWVEGTEDGSLSDLSSPPSDEVWEEVRSDSDICLRARCPHFQTCFYQRARREASGADLLVVNHHLLFSDVALRAGSPEAQGGSLVLPAYRHLVLDEAHNVEDAATSHLGAQVTRIGLFRLLSRLDRRGKGILATVEERLRVHSGDLEGKELLQRLRKRVRPGVRESREALEAFFDLLEPVAPSPGEGPLRLGGEVEPGRPDSELGEALEVLLSRLHSLRREVEELRSRIELSAGWEDRLEGRVLDLRSVERRLMEGAEALRTVLRPESREAPFVRWIESRESGADRRDSNVLLAAAPVEPGPLLREALFDRMETTVLTSATLAVRDRFDFVRERLGLREESPELSLSETVVPSPFDFSRQALLCVPTDVPDPARWDAFQEATARIVERFTGITGGGVFVLFTSHRAVRDVAHLLRRGGVEGRWPLFVQGEAPRHRLLEGFVGSGDGLLLGTSSFWEGVDVPGRPLRGLVLQKLPFRVPTEPVTEARIEAMEARGENSFWRYVLPLAALRLKQGFGRLVRSRTDRGAVLLLDGRILRRRYGSYLRAALPPAPQRSAPWSRLEEELRAFYGAGVGELLAPEGPSAREERAGCREPGPA